LTAFPSATSTGLSPPCGANCTPPAIPTHVCPGAGRGAVLEQQLHDPLVAAATRDVQRCLAVLARSSALPLSLRSWRGCWRRGAAAAASWPRRRARRPRATPVGRSVASIAPSNERERRRRPLGARAAPGPRPGCPIVPRTRAPSRGRPGAAARAPRPRAGGSHDRAERRVAWGPTWPLREVRTGGWRTRVTNEAQNGHTPGVSGPDAAGKEEVRYEGNSVGCWRQ
jgi:hypothetical protein